MSVVIVGGNECMVKRYEDLCKSYSCKAKVFVKQDRGLQNFGNPDLMHKKTELLTVLTDIFSPDTSADGLEICPILPSPSFLSRQKSVPLKLLAPKTDYFCRDSLRTTREYRAYFKEDETEYRQKEPLSASGFGSLMHIVFFTDTMSHKMLNTVSQQAKKKQIRVAHCRTGSMSALKGVLDSHIAQGG